jgi:hypothetical protein
MHNPDILHLYIVLYGMVDAEVNATRSRERMLILCHYHTYRAFLQGRFADYQMWRIPIAIYDGVFVRIDTWLSSASASIGEYWTWVC